MSRGERRVRRTITGVAALIIAALAVPLPWWSLIPVTVLVAFMAVVANTGGGS